MGWVLVPAPYAVTIIERIIAELMDGKGLLSHKPITEKAPERKDSTPLLLRVIHCNGCTERMHRIRSSGTYGCSSYKYGTYCPALYTVCAEWVGDHVTNEFLQAAGRIYRPCH
ncbi:hypothetical protein GCM10018785_34080 [Streptomyces longispororuber]|uniref:Recombinase zinc beta ribbon domain-containing protein n=1 Tax=Streptomyces longispororuber TaxID=68230 RepID=A0A918ZNW5_9ACTN|nr:hypothetical protein [Streptomyces longispororuber]GHE62232.1 hypothetical protein GCM10018785_34080 [Streptomyces longispororuber]